MEPAKIDWKNLEWNFAVDELYEHLNAPKFVDFLSLNHNINNNDDEAWFCKPGLFLFLLCLWFFSLSFKLILNCVC